MATYDEIEHGSPLLSDILKTVTITSLSTLSRGLLLDLISPFINNFNRMNYDFMTIHMIRNAFEKSITLANVGENAYTNGDSEVLATPAQKPSYTRGNNYRDFVDSVRDEVKNGNTTPRVNTVNGVENKYFDAEDPNLQISYNSSIDKNSILYKTQRLFRLKKLKTIISQFHTEGVEYVGQVGSKFGESHGRNLLTKKAALGDTSYDGYKVNGYDNPYCRVWTNHHKYDKISKTMRANSGSMNYWPGFEWDKTDKGHDKDSSVYGDGENYDYAWRGKHNQDRRKENSVLDTKTGLVKMTPQYNGSFDSKGIMQNRHTKECMFSIENLAWKDYDPYSFEEALSWEQRGPFGGRIMWFPPYGIEITETATAKWNSNEFIGRGEPVYTYVNSERSGNLSFLMLTDHPSSVDYASWWADNNETENATDSSGNCENDYLRYFVGCANGDNGLIDETKDDPNDSKPGGLIVKPTPLTDEYIQPTPPPVIDISQYINTPAGNTNDQQSTDKNPIKIKFYVFYPNNYSGVMDAPTNPQSQVNAIAYLLGGRNAMKSDAVNDIPLSLTGNFGGNGFIGYEMKETSITTTDCISKHEYIQGGVKDVSTYTVDDNVRYKKWQYRVDHIQPYEGDNEGYHNGTNLLNQVFQNRANYIDDKGKKLNLEVNDHIITKLAGESDNVYSFAEVAAAIYSEGFLNSPNLYNYLIQCGVNTERVQALVDIFTNPNLKLTNITCSGYATTQGPDSVNIKLSENRALTILNWLKSIEIWKDVETKITSGGPKEVEAGDKGDVNGLTSKLYRSAQCEMEFTSGAVQDEAEFIKWATLFGYKLLPEIGVTDSVEDKREIPGFHYEYSKPMPDGKIWKYYSRDGSVRYYDQQVGSSDNYDEPEKNDVVVTEDQILQIFNTEGYKPTKEPWGAYVYSWELAALVEKAAAVLCWTTDELYEKINSAQEPDSTYVSYTAESNPEYSCIWKYGITNNLVTTTTVTTATNLCSYVETQVGNCWNSDDESLPIRFTNEEKDYITLLVEDEISKIGLEWLKRYIILSRVLDGINKIQNSYGTRNVCLEPAKNDDEMKAKTVRIDEGRSGGTGCASTLWVDRGDGLLIEECYIDMSDMDKYKVTSRFNKESGEGDWNKLRYDQEYHFYKQWIDEHPLMFEKLQEKIKYFNPAFHSMTPEGFNARCTFLQQCTRQGNTRTMSDNAGKTANNLAFGRPPYCVLRLGDFYYQMIVIENVTFDYGVADGIQWDLNTEGNGVQPMLCKVNISFKFIGGGDITGPVQRLQNAMSFNYYSNASFYDNRADRVQYQPTNWATMGGAGNNKVDLNNSYAYVPKYYQDTKLNIVNPVVEVGE